MNDPRLSMFHALGLPVVTIERDLGADDDAWCVTSDNDANTGWSSSIWPTAARAESREVPNEVPFAECKNAPCVKGLRATWPLLRGRCAGAERGGTCSPRSVLSEAQS
jgi:hypothetical protein